MPQNEQPCFAIQDITLTGDAAGQFQFALRHAMKQSGFQPGMCLGALGVNHMMTLAQNAVIDRGYTTTRILAAPQDLKSGHLVFTVIPGRIHALRYDTRNAEATHVGRIMAFDNKFPAKAGDILNLRDLEQGLENLKRNPTAEADISIEPAEAPNESDVVIRWQQRLIPWRVALNVDDSGSRSTGKYQAGITLAGDNPLGLSDLFYVNYTQDLGTKDRLTDSTGQRTDSSTRSYALHYSVPIGNWLLAVNHNYYRYHQAIAGLNENYDYNGDSSNTDLGLTRLLYRDAHRRTNLTAKLWKRESHNYINDAQLDIQHRRTAGWAANIEHKEYLGNSLQNREDDWTNE
ncbi:ShlB/FhaC/HecB family hemolysin secretion/activation protein [Snodgrassella sp. CFCC 13594]|uniref:ShlB/FhaC/HecB family hemolysin secretion/activation protein n=1 Tax=Snodgrassella sp. CFCC 13594 TaxID=1775559 RepID=UPI00082E8EBE|nr:ShlB/FhaC/HecB family hemolysin secretion/activation protein [Snodgrassella sp. CFCC 13594]